MINAHRDVHAGKIVIVLDPGDAALLSAAAHYTVRNMPNGARAAERRYNASVRNACAALRFELNRIAAGDK